MSADRGNTVAASPGAAHTGATTPGDLEQLLAAKEIVVFCGSGGVGKTSIAAASALGAAARLGGKILVLTVDPARRLATALGLEGIGNTARRVPPEVCTEAGIELRGELWAAMLDTKESWDTLVLRHAPDEETASKILDNVLYKNITERFVQSHDYIAMERLYDVHASGEYDLIVLDTPPTRNAIDFLEAPKRMADFFGGRLLRWLTAPYRVGGKRGARILNFASRPFYQVADRILGSEFLQEIGEFFWLFQSMYDGFVERASAVEDLLHDRRTTFGVVTTLEAAPLREGEVFMRELKSRGFDFQALVLNKTLPDTLLDPSGAAAATYLIDHASDLAGELREVLGHDSTDEASDDRVARVLSTVGESFRNFGVVAKREAELRSELSKVPHVLARVPTLEVDIHDVRGLAEIGDHLFEGTTR
ncbi:MAG: AAA family ATPase [Acidimicrobiia bacterium]|nr:AAA family ATPase [Acidimicrobiia bacterium]